MASDSQSKQSSTHSTSSVVDEKRWSQVIVRLGALCYDSVLRHCQMGGSK